MNKKLNLLFGLLIGFLIMSCSKDNENNPQSTNAELLAQNSPWIFKNYDLINIVDARNSNLTQQELENDIDQSANGSTLTFNQNGTGNSSVQGQSNSINWQWEIANNNELKIIFTGSNPETLTFYNLVVTSTKMSYEEEVLTMDTNIGSSVTHYGTFNFE